MHGKAVGVVDRRVMKAGDTDTAKKPFKIGDGERDFNRLAKAWTKMRQVWKEACETGQRTFFDDTLKDDLEDMAADLGIHFTWSGVLKAKKEKGDSGKQRGKVGRTQATPTAETPVEAPV